MNRISDSKIVILLTIDCLRSDHLKSYGYQRNTAPNIENFVNNGATFLNAFANGSETATSFSSIFSSTYPYLNGGFSPLPDQKLIFPQILQENGIITYGLHSNYYIGKHNNYHRGFNVFIDGIQFFLKKKKGDKQIKEKGSKLTVKQKIIHRISLIWKRIRKNYISKVLNQIGGIERIKNVLHNFDFFQNYFSQLDLKGFRASYIVKSIIGFLQKCDLNSSYFIWAHFMDAHNPYDPPNKNLLKFTRKRISPQEREFLNGKFFFRPKKEIITPESIEKLINLYDGEVNYVDENLGKLFEYIKSRFKKKCLVIILADHGDSFYEHETFGHQGHLHDELMKVPLFLIDIGRKIKYKKITQLVDLIDIAPTILDYYGIDIPKYFQGKSLIPLVNDKTLFHKNYIISETYQKGGRFKKNNVDGYKVFSIRDKKWKYIYDEEKEAEFLYDLENDPKEVNNVVNTDLKSLEPYRSIRDYHFKRIKESVESSKINLAVKNLKMKF